MARGADLLGDGAGRVPRLNLAAGLLAVAAATCISFTLDPFLHMLGDWLLSLALFQTAVLAVLRLPFGPWTELNNTVVAGSLAVVVGLALPTYWLTRTVFARQATRFADHWLLRFLGMGSRTGWRI